MKTCRKCGVRYSKAYDFGQFPFKHVGYFHYAPGSSPTYYPLHFFTTHRHSTSWRNTAVAITLVILSLLAGYLITHASDTTYVHLPCPVCGTDSVRLVQSVKCIDGEKDYICDRGHEFREIEGRIETPPYIDDRSLNLPMPNTSTLETIPIYDVIDTTPPAAPQGLKVSSTGIVIQMMPDWVRVTPLPKYTYIGLSCARIVTPPASQQVVWSNFPDTTRGGTYTPQVQMVAGDTVALDTAGFKAQLNGNWMVRKSNIMFIIRNGR